MPRAHFRRLVVPRASAAHGRLRVLVTTLAVVAVLPSADRASYEWAAAAAQSRGAGKSQPQSWRSPRHARPLPPPLGASPFAHEFVVTGAEQREEGESGESYVPAGGDGTFGPPSPILGLDVVDGADVADMDGDGDLDFLIAEGTSGDVFLYRNLGQGSFAPERVAAGVSTRFSTNLRIADFNGDGRPDFVVGDMRVVLGTKVYLQNPAGRFRISDALDMGWNDEPFDDPFDDPFEEEDPLMVGVAVGDLNGDGRIDIAILGYEGEGNGEVRLYLGNGRGRFSKPVLLFDVEEDFGRNLNVTGLAAFDLENDGDFDLVVGAGDGRHFIYVNDGTGAFTAPAGAAYEVEGQSGIDAYDADHDGDHDLIVVSIAGPLYYVENLGGTLAPPVQVASLTGFGVAVGAPPIALTAP